MNWKSERDDVVNDPDVQPDVRGVFDRFRSEMKEALISDSTLQQSAWVIACEGKAYLETVSPEATVGLKACRCNPGEGELSKGNLLFCTWWLIQWSKRRNVPPNHK